MSDVADPDPVDHRPDDIDPEAGLGQSIETPSHSDKDVVQTTESIGSEDSGGDADSGVAADDDVEKPYVQLYIKAAKDRRSLGSCPICQRYFMAFYLLREQGLIDLAVTTFAPESPPEEVTSWATGKRYPLLKINKGTDVSGKPFTDVECDTVDEIEAVITRFGSAKIASRQYSAAEDEAERSFDLLFQKFRLFLQDRKDEATMLVRYLNKLNAYLEEVYNKADKDEDGRKAKYMRGADLTRADCQVMPLLQHIRVAGYAYKGFDVPEDCKYIWLYLYYAYQSDAFLNSCPSNAEIIRHYEHKASCKPKRGVPSKDDETGRNMAVPEDIIKDIISG